MTMMFLPNEADATYSDQAEPDSVDFEILLAGARLTGVVSGCEVTESGTPAQTIDVAVGVVRVAGRQVTVAADTGVAVTAADGTNPRIDLITSNLSGVIVVTAGTPAAQPVLPAIPATSVPLATLYIPANDNTHGDAQINDKRVTVPAQTVFNVKDYGALGDGSTDDTANIQTAIDAAIVINGTVLFPTNDDYYKVTSLEITATNNGLTLQGAGEGCHMRGSGDTFDFTGSVKRMVMANLRVETTGAGKACLQFSNAGKLSQSTIRDCSFHTYSTTGHAIDAESSTWEWQDNLLLNNTYSADGVAVSVPIINLIDTHANSGGICGDNQFVGGRIIGAAGITAPEVFLECQGANYFYNNRFVGINFEIPTAGAIHGNGQKFLAIRDNGFFDLGTATDDMIILGKHTSGLRSDSNTIENTHRIGGTISTFYDIALDDAHNTIIVASGGHAASTGKIDANGMSGTLIIRPHADTLDNITTNVSVQMGSDAAREYATAKTLDRTHGVVNMESTAATRAVTLPDNADYAGHNFLIRRDGTNDVTVTRAGSDTFDDAATVKTLGSDGAAIGIFSIGDGEWKIVGTQGTVT